MKMRSRLDVSRSIPNGPVGLRAPSFDRFSCFRGEGTSLAEGRDPRAADNRIEF